MKHTVTKLFLLLLLAVAGRMAKAQTHQFAPLGATWYYETQSMFTKGYIKMEVEKDTVIDSRRCIKLNREEYWHNLEFGGLSPYFPVTRKRLCDGLSRWCLNCTSTLEPR